MGAATLVSPVIVARFRRSSQLGGILVTAVGLTTLAGWEFDIPALRSLHPSWEAMKANTAVCLTLLGAALLCFRDGRQRRRETTILAASALVIAVATLSQDAIGWHLGIDQLLVADASSPTRPGRMAPNTAVLLGMLATAIVRLDGARRVRLSSQWLAVLAATVALITVCGYIYGVSALYQIPGFGSISMYTALALLTLSLSVLAAQPEGGLMVVLSADTVGSRLARRMLPVIVAVPIGIGWLRLLGEQRGYYGTAFGLALFTVSNVLTIGAIAWHTTRRLIDSEMSERESAEALRRSQGLLEAISDNSSAVIYAKDLEGRYLYINRRFSELFNRSPAALLGHTDYDLFTRDEAEVFRAMDSRVASAGVALTAEEPVPVDGAVQTYLSVKCPLRDETGRIYAVFGISTDITDRKQAETRLRAQLERLNLLDTLTRAIGTRQDLDSVLQVVVRSVEDQLLLDFCCIGFYDRGDDSLDIARVGVRSQALAERLSMPERARVAVDQNGLRRCVNGQLVYEPDLAGLQFPFPQRLAGGGLRSLVAAPLLVESTIFGVLIAARRTPSAFSSGECEFLRQLSEHVALAAQQAQLYAALQRAYDDLKQTQQAVAEQERLRVLGQMASGIAHDINNAISPIALCTDLLMEAEPNLSAQSQRHLSDMRTAVEDVAHTVDRLREFYRDRESQPQLARVDVNSLTREVVSLTRAKWSDMPQQRGVVIHVVTQLADTPLIQGVESDLRQALINLVFNAVDAMPEGGTVTLRTRVIPAPDGSAAAERVAIEVSDTGVGMSDETRQHCLEPFFTTKGRRGTGLGLATVYGTAQRHSADLEIESEPGRGTTVRLAFLVPSPVTTETVAPTPPARIAPVRILIIDDDPVLLRSLHDALRSDGHMVTAADGGQAGIDAFRRARDEQTGFALVITDLGMPAVDGRKVASAIKELSPSTPLVMLTGWGQRMIDEGDLPSYVDRVLAKPPRLSDLRLALADLTSRQA